jgi:anti-sigma B factor antagonist
MVNDVDITEHNGVAVVTVRGELDLATVPTFQSRLHRAIDTHAGQTVVVDLDGVGSVDANGLGVLVAALGRATSHGGDIVLVCNSPALRQQLAACRLNRVFSVHDTVTEAVNQAQRGR